jgi:uncharacterized HhH-GPD family protein
MDNINEALKVFRTSDKVKKIEEGFGGGRCPQYVNDFYLKGKNYFAFLLGVLYDQQIPAEIVWEIPYKMCLMLGHLNPELISQMSDKDILSLFEKLPRKPRYPPQMAQQTVEAAKKVLSNYNGKVENMWADNPTCTKIQQRFEAFPGIGQKKAAMATDVLVKRFKIPLRDRSGIDIAADSLVMRVFKRCGFVNYEDKALVISKARQLNPDYPGVLDYPCWIIGRDYCFLTSPDCEHCPIGNCCPKLI